ncbi:hypothetical protein NPX13_g7639 [Xylaria arbuscula]|uniref:Uncharacterized protein n=1 Tax=Xylaria arbuscula TaxID=114810 RepID=A0A9W8TK75_9PEZI|nr:hypothetical protein NPX13_g7639 [Xylaria arbuscula]
MYLPQGNSHSGSGSKKGGSGKKGSSGGKSGGSGGKGNSGGGSGSGGSGSGSGGGGGKKGGSSERDDWSAVSQMMPGEMVVVMDAHEGQLVLAGLRGDFRVKHFPSDVDVSFPYVPPRAAETASRRDDNMTKMFFKRHRRNLAMRASRQTRSDVSGPA